MINLLFMIAIVIAAAVRMFTKGEVNTFLIVAIIAVASLMLHDVLFDIYLAVKY